ncbi:hypothetical protein D3C73_1211240 [compost metagenome]
MTPPRTGPRMGPSRVGMPIIETTRPRLLPADRTSTVCRVGIRIPAPMPCSSRKTIRLPGFQAKAHKIEPARNTVSEKRYTFLPPKRLVAQPDIGIAMPIVRM